jgi:hypothetical protein
MAVDLSVRLSADPACLALASAVARRYIELAGGEAAEATALGQAVAAAADEVVRGGDHVDVVFNREPGGVAVEVSCAGRRRHCHAALSPK